MLGTCARLFQRSSDRFPSRLGLKLDLRRMSGSAGMLTHPAGCAVTWPCFKFASSTHSEGHTLRAEPNSHRCAVAAAALLISVGGVCFRCSISSPPVDKEEYSGRFLRESIAQAKAEPKRKVKAAPVAKTGFGGGGKAPPVAKRSDAELIKESSKEYDKLCEKQAKQNIAFLEYVVRAHPSPVVPPLPAADAMLSRTSKRLDA